jgi:hypothetical protein
VLKNQSSLAASGISQSATIIAALIAAGVAFFKIVADAFAARSAEARATHRQVLAPYLGDIGVAVHEVVSGAVLLYRRAQQGQARGNAGVQAARGAETLKLKRLQVKYPLAGPEEPLRTLSRGYDWASTYRATRAGRRSHGARQTATAAPSLRSKF